jgi:uncharacterized protein YdeI (YjbR/CyaY-like superfamily)
VGDGDDLAALRLGRALRGLSNEAAHTAFEGLSFSHREYVDAINEAKRLETRARRVERAVTALIERASGG